MWTLLIPAMLIVIFVFSMVQYKPLSYEDYVFPDALIGKSSLFKTSKEISESCRVLAGLVEPKHFRKFTLLDEVGVHSMCTVN